jgi:hypothetical protein
MITSLQEMGHLAFWHAPDADEDYEDERERLRELVRKQVRLGSCGTSVRCGCCCGGGVKG